MPIVYDDERPPEGTRAATTHTGAPLDQYQRAAVDERAALLKSGAPLQESGLGGYTRRLAQGVGMNWTDEALAGGQVPLEMIKRGLINPAEAYRYTKAREDLSLDKTRQATGMTGSVIEGLGGLATGAAGAGSTGAIIQKVVPKAIQYGKNVLGAGGLGAAAGAGEGNSLEERGKGLLMGGTLGLGIGAAAPAVISGVGAAMRPLAAPLRRFTSSSPTAATRSADDIAVEQTAKVIRDSGQKFDDIALKVANADAAGQGGYTVADAIGLAGQRKLAGVAKQPGPARDEIAQALSENAAGRGHRLGGAVDDALGVRGTAEEAREALTQQARQQARPYYRAAEQVRPVWNDRMQQFFDAPTIQVAMRKGYKIQRDEALAEGRAFNPRDYAITQFNEAGDPVMSAVPNMRTIDMIKKGLDKKIEAYRDKTTGRLVLDDEGRALNNVKNAMLHEVDQLNPLYGQARAIYADPASVRSAIDLGRQATAANRRPTDTMRVFDQLSDTRQQGFRIGYADRIAAALEGRGQAPQGGVPFPPLLRSTKGNAELDRMSLIQGPSQPGRPSQLRQFIDRENSMQETLKHARGGSSTAENVVDMVDTSPSMMGMLSSLYQGRYLDALRQAAQGGRNVMTGETEAQRLAIARMLMTSGGDPAAVQAMGQRIAEHEARRRSSTPFATRAIEGAVANVAPPPPSFF